MKLKNVRQVQKSLVLYTLSLFCDDSKDKKKGSHPYLLSSDWHTENGVEK